MTTIKFTSDWRINDELDILRNDEEGTLIISLNDQLQNVGGMTPKQILFHLVDVAVERAEIRGIGLYRTQLKEEIGKVMTQVFSF